MRPAAGAYTPADLARELAICEAAQTPPWRTNQPDAPGGRKVGEDWTIGKFGASPYIGPNGVERYCEVYVTTDCVRCSETNGSSAIDDARFVAAARTGYPRALREVERLTAEVEALRRRKDRTA